MDDRPDQRSASDIEAGDRLTPRYDAAGLITAVVQDATSGEVLMLAHMNADALRLTQEQRVAWFWSRSRASLWKKGESSGNVLHVVDLLIDCDQDAVLIRAAPAGPACHTGARRCFYRRIESNRLVPA